MCVDVREILRCTRPNVSFLFFSSREICIFKKLFRNSEFYSVFEVEKHLY